MDRLIALLAAMVALIGLGGALLVHNNATAVMTRQAAEIAQLKASLTLINQRSTTRPSSEPPADDGTADALLALQTRIVSLEQAAAAQAAAPEAAAVAPATEIAATQPDSSDSPAALSDDGPTTDCIPLGTRFMAQSGDSFPICKTKVVVEISQVTDGSALVAGAGPVAAGGFASLPQQGCTIMVFTADITGFAEMRVSCV
jgi:hypothetical protein